MKTKISFIIMLVIMIASLGSTQAFAQGQGKCEQHGKEGMGGGICKGDKNMTFIKDLTEDQQKQIDALKMNLIKESISTKNLIEEKQAHLKTISTGDNVDMAAVNKTIDELFALKADMSKKHETFKQDVRKLLTPDQKVMFDIHAGKGQGKGCEMKGMGQGCDMKGMRGNCKMEGNGHGMGMGNGNMTGCSHMGSCGGSCKDKAAGEGCKGKGGDGQGCGKMQGCEGHGHGEGNSAGCCKKKE